MSFNVHWNNLETESLREYTTEILTNALNSDKLPSILADTIQIKQLNFGKVAPTFEILEIGELDQDRFRGIFKINYSGDFELVLHTKVQANPLNLYRNEDSFVMPNFGLAIEKFNLPLDLKLSNIKILGIGIIVFSKSKGLTLVFRNDPLDNIVVLSTFDTVQVLATFLQNQIETQIRDLFRETLPTLIHQLSLRYLNLDGVASAGSNALKTNSEGVGLKSDSNISEENNFGGNATSFGSNINPDIDDYNLDNYSTTNLVKICKLYKSRETLSLKVPTFTNIISRSNLEKFTANQPNLLNYLKKMNGIDVKTNINNNEIPLELLLDKNFDETDNILLNISKIQNFNYKLNFKNDVVKPKRRRIKIRGTKNSKNSSADESKKSSKSSNSIGIDRDSLESPIFMKNPVPAQSTPTLSTSSNSMNFSSPVVDSPVPKQNPLLFTPKPTKDSTLVPLKPIDSLHIDLHSHLDSPSLLSRVGLGNSSYFQFPPKSPIKSRAVSPVEEQSINIDKINQELKKYNQLNRGRSLNDHKWNNFPGGVLLDSISPPPPPPPYYYNI